MQANILWPLTHVGTFNLRYDAVEELLASEELVSDSCKAVRADFQPAAADMMGDSNSNICMQANILQPLTHVGTLNLRYEAVGELLASEELLVDAAQGLAALPRDLDKVCRGLVCASSWAYWLVKHIICSEFSLLLKLLAGRSSDSYSVGWCTLPLAWLPGPGTLTKSAAAW